MVEMCLRVADVIRGTEEGRGDARITFAAAAPEGRNKHTRAKGCSPLQKRLYVRISGAKRNAGAFAQHIRHVSRPVASDKSLGSEELFLISPGL